MDDGMREQPASLAEVLTEKTKALLASNLGQDNAAVAYVIMILSRRLYQMARLRLERAVQRFDPDTSDEDSKRIQKILVDSAAEAAEKPFDVNRIPMDVRNVLLDFITQEVELVNARVKRARLQKAYAHDEERKRTPTVPLKNPVRIVNGSEVIEVSELGRRKSIVIRSDDRQLENEFINSCFGFTVEDVDAPCVVVLESLVDINVEAEVVSTIELRAKRWSGCADKSGGPAAALDRSVEGLGVDFLVVRDLSLSSGDRMDGDWLQTCHRRLWSWCKDRGATMVSFVKPDVEKLPHGYASILTLSRDDDGVVLEGNYPGEEFCKEE